MKKLLLSFICLYGFVLSNAVTSQELNEAFLKSLPKSIQEDFLNAADADHERFPSLRCTFDKRV